MGFLPVISKIFEKLLSYEITQFLHQFLFKFQCGFFKRLKKSKIAIGTKEAFGTFLTDLSKIFDCLSLELIITKLKAYEFSLSGLNLNHN